MLARTRGQLNTIHTKIIHMSRKRQWPYEWPYEKVEIPSGKMYRFVSKGDKQVFSMSTVLTI